MLLLLVSFALASPVQAQTGVSANLIQGLAKGIGGAVGNQLTGYALSAIGLSGQANGSGQIADQLNEISSQLTAIATELTTIASNITTQTCSENLNSSSLVDALATISTVNDTYSTLLFDAQNGATPSAADIQCFVNQVFLETTSGLSCPSGGTVDLITALNTINTQLQGVNNQGLIGSCESAVTSLPAVNSLGADGKFYKDPISLLSYFANYQVLGTMLLIEAYHYQAWLGSPYSSSGQGLPPALTAQICLNPTTSATATNCDNARFYLQQLYVYLQNQYSVNGVPYSTTDANGNLLTGLFVAPDSKYYLLVTSLEDFTSTLDPGANCSSPLKADNPCGLAAQNTGTSASFPSTATYGYVSGWVPFGAQGWRAVVEQWTSSSETLESFLDGLGFQNMADKIILTPTSYDATVHIFNQCGVENATPFTAPAMCFLDTQIPRSFAHQPWCYNGSLNGTDYGLSSDLLCPYGTYHSQECLYFLTTTELTSDTNGPSFYAGRYNSKLSSGTGGTSSSCPDGTWVNGVQPGWLIDAATGTAGAAYYWPSFDFSTPTCGSNMAFGTQGAVARTGLNFRGVATMCGDDFDRFFMTVAPANPFMQLAVDGAIASDTVASSPAVATLPITVGITNSYGQVPPNTVSGTVPVDTTVTLSSMSATGVFAASPGGTAVTTVTIPAGQSSVTFYYGDSTPGTPTITADPGNMLPLVQGVQINALGVVSIEGKVQAVGSTKGNGSVKITAKLIAPGATRLDRAVLTLIDLMHEAGGSGELGRKANGSALAPLVLTPRKGSKATEAIYETASGVQPSVRVEVKVRDSKSGLAEVSIKVDRGSIRRPSKCSGGKQPITALRTRLSLDESGARRMRLDATAPWQCRGDELKTP